MPKVTAESFSIDCEKDKIGNFECDYSRTVTEKFPILDFRKTSKE